MLSTAAERVFSSLQITPHNCQLLQNPRHRASLASEEQAKCAKKQNRFILFEELIFSKKITVEYDVLPIKKMCNRKNKM